MTAMDPAWLAEIAWKQSDEQAARDEAWAAARRDAARIEPTGPVSAAVLALHRPSVTEFHGGRLVAVCSHCDTGDPYSTVSQDWPCPTVEAIRDAQA